MANNHLIICSTSYVIKLKQWDTTTHLNGQNPQHWQYHMLVRVWGNGDSHLFWWDCKMIQLLWKTFWQFLTKLNILLQYHPVVMLLGIYPKQLKTYIHTKTCTRVYSSCIHSCQNLETAGMSFSEWMNKWIVVHTDNGTLFSTKKKWTIKPWEDMKKC